ncbi:MULTISPECIES: glycoside hydrolase family 15 protein [Geodermatophilaceae]|uniref:Glycoside hydrolase family 15 protein n=1 Tax=Blastococcus saxobsidens TaxID=138336 RepID=A0A6L9W6X3_9ACTN|nr:MULTISPECIES: glycoside hydrolase family 15 protein [Geodermatophilaceae]NEK87797.1 glycoside hydrolase family 15 protein [Blastococcus saxobsidens]RBY86961.1 glycoside hydrolase family 15 protein [Blastococcus sp. TF02A-26]TFV52807.1 glycoside hydrolase family 15 protein [Blastococcus sp. TF02A_35]SDO60752.1 Glucoamylase (glucan-1,4-alpha-glucosidase), GH15 family [Geodermatophilus sp. DSM 45219]
MLDLDPGFRPIRLHDGYPPLADLGLIGDGATAALVGLDGVIRWMCVPDFDSEPLFCSLLDSARGGSFIVVPERLVEARQRYEPDTGVLITELRSDTGLVRLTDALALRSGADLTDDAPADRGELVRSAVVLSGYVRLRVAVQPRGGAQPRPAFNGLAVECARQPGLRLHLRSNRPLPGLLSTHDLQQGDRLDLVLSWGRLHRHHPLDAEARLAETADGWRRWMTGFSYDGPQPDMVRRAAITLKLCDHWAHGSLVAAPTSSLPAPVGGIRNWDYRYTWVRDAAYAVFALRRIGFVNEADAYLGWVLDAFERSRQPRIMYTIAGDPIPDEWEDVELEGYRGSAPVRWGNGAADQRQHDVYGEVLDCADQWVKAGGRLDPALWGGLSGIADAAGRAWRQPDQGIWEVRSSGRVFTYSAAMCQVALDRAAATGEQLGLAGPLARWRREAADLRETILTRAWNEDAKTLSEHLDGGDSLDASLLALPLRGVIPADHPRMVATTAAIAERLSAGDGLLYRYRHDESPDGLAGDEGAFLLCSFWLVDNLVLQGKLDEAEGLYASLCARASPLGLLSEQIDPSSGELTGNFPQAFSHIGVIASGVNLARAMRRGR